MVTSSWFLELYLCAQHSANSPCQAYIVTLILERRNQGSVKEAKSIARDQFVRVNTETHISWFQSPRAGDHVFLLPLPWEL